jgi:hypothetical protein
MITNKTMTHHDKKLLNSIIQSMQGNFNTTFGWAILSCSYTHIHIPIVQLSQLNYKQHIEQYKISILYSEVWLKKGHNHTHVLLRSNSTCSCYNFCKKINASEIEYTKNHISISRPSIKTHILDANTGSKFIISKSVQKADSIPYKLNLPEK